MGLWSIRNVCMGPSCYLFFTRFLVFRANENGFSVEIGIKADSLVFIGVESVLIGVVKRKNYRVLVNLLFQRFSKFSMNA